MTTLPPLQERLAAVRQQVAEAARRAGRDAGDITTVVITKFQPVELVRELYDLGVRDFGESRHPEARDKQAALPDARWHFVGQLQTNKARQVARYADVLQSVDRPALVHALEGTAATVLIQIDLAGNDAGRGGAAPDAAPVVGELALAAGLDVRGVMAVAPRGEDPARAFDRLNDAAVRLRAVAPAATWISAGMSADFREAIDAGATHLRVGSAITGPRPERR